MRDRSTRGFTLVETLAAVLILLLLTAAIAAGTSAAVRVRSGSLFISESDQLALTVNTALGDLLHYADYDPDASDADTTAFSNRGAGVLAGRLLTKDGRLYIAASSGADAALLALIGDGAYTDLAVENVTMTYEDGVFTGAYDITGTAEQHRTVPFTFQPVNG